MQCFVYRALINYLISLNPNSFTSNGLSSRSEAALFFGSEIREMQRTLSTVNTSLSSNASTFNKSANNSGEVTRLMHSLNSIKFSRFYADHRANSITWVVPLVRTVPPIRALEKHTCKLSTSDRSIRPSFLISSGHSGNVHSSQSSIVSHSFAVITCRSILKFPTRFSLFSSQSK